jgi:uncharacterized protein YqjF (DUF2071 family)
LPEHTELDLWRGQAFVSLVGFQFLDTRVWGLAIPFHRHFSEVNLRFYVRRKVPEGWRRSVVFIRELAPRRAIAWTARVLYGENYRTVPLWHRVDAANGNPAAERRVSYAWKLARREHAIELVVAGEGRPAAPGSFEEFIIDHEWGASGGPGRRTIEYRVQHPPWNLWMARRARFTGDARRVYGAALAEALSAPPASAFLADGSPVTVYRGARVA